MELFLFCLAWSFCGLGVALIIDGIIKAYEGLLYAGLACVFAFAILMTIMTYA